MTCLFLCVLSLLPPPAQQGMKKHPELSVGSNADGADVRSVGNSATLQETRLLEAFNLRFAIRYKQRKMAEAAAALRDMPPRAERELDCVTLHNKVRPPFRLLLVPLSPPFGSQSPHPRPPPLLPLLPRDTRLRRP